MTLTLLLALAALQDAQPPAEPPPAEPPPAIETTAAAEEWHRISASDIRAYLADISSIKTEGGVTTIAAASAFLTPDAAGDQSHMGDVYEIRCRSEEYRAVVSYDVLPDGTRTDLTEPDPAWEEIPSSGLIPVLKQVACDNARAPQASYPSVQAFLDSRE